MFDYKMQGRGLKIEDDPCGLKVTYSAETAPWSRVAHPTVCLNDNIGVTAKLDGVTVSQDSDYSLVTMIGNGTCPWYDANGYLVIYGQSGEFSIVATSPEIRDPNRSFVIVSEKREPLKGAVTLHLNKEGEDYCLTVNRKTYRFPATFSDAPLADPSHVCFSFGLFSDGKIGTINFNKTFDKGDISFMIHNIQYDGASERTLRPLASTFALFTGVEGSFRPDDALTRGEAVSAVVSLYANLSDLKDTYTTDFKDVAPTDALYTAVAFAQRTEMLPFDGELFEADAPITRREWASLVLEAAAGYGADDVTFADVSEDDALFGRACYAVATDMMEADGGAFKPDATVTRGEAARFLCRFIGKKANGEALYTFEDVPADHPYAADIALAATPLAVREVYETVTPADDLNAVVAKAYALADSTPTRVTLTLKGGVYTRLTPIAIEHENKDLSNFELILRNAEGEKPVLKGSLDIPAAAFTPVEGKGYYRYNLPESAKINGQWPRFRNLYLDGQYLNLAASEEFVFTKALRNSDPSTGRWTFDNWFYVTDKYLSDLTQETIRPLEICFNVEWMNKRFRVNTYEGIDEESGLVQLTVMDEEWQFFLGWDGNKRNFVDKVYWYQNHLSLLDEPGEFFYDDGEGIIYFYPYADTDMSTATVSYPVAEVFFDLTRTGNITFDGITFVETTSNFVSDHGYNGGLGGIYLGYFPESSGDKGHIPSAAILGRYTANVRVINCVFDCLGGHGIYLDYGNRNVTVKGNSFTDLAMSGATLGRQYPDWTLPAGLMNLVVDNNYINNIGIDYLLSPGVQITRVKNAAITHNTMIHTPYCGIMNGWFMSPADAPNSRNVEVAYNYCEDNLYAINDGSGIYLPGANAAIATTETLLRCHHNFVKATGYDGTYNGIYLDANASNWLVEENVLDGFNVNMGPIYSQGKDPKVHYGLFLQTTYNNVIRHNYATIKAVDVHEWEDGGTMADRNIVLEANEFFPKSADLSQEARAIIAMTGQKKAYQSLVPVKETEVVMTTSDAHIFLTPNEKPDTAHVTFTVTNNDDHTATYEAVVTNLEAIEGMVSVVYLGEKALTLAPGQTGKLEVAFEAKSETGKVIPELALVKDNGWKRRYRRVINVKVNS